MTGSTTTAMAGWTCSPTRAAATRPEEPSEDPQCDDGLDNDDDGLVDWDGFGSGDPDPQCLDRPWRDRELPSPCGLGFEVLALLPLLRALAARRRLSSTPTPLA